VQNVLTSSKLIIVIGFIILGFASGNGHWSHFSEPAVRTSTAASAHGVSSSSLLWVMVGYSGWNAATYVAEEVRRPERTSAGRAGGGHGHRSGALRGAEHGVHLRHSRWKP
jgi:basic amino acid/polyamine antiporter, APA family